MRLIANTLKRRTVCAAAIAGLALLSAACSQNAPAPATDAEASGEKAATAAWEHNFDDALQQAKAEQKPLLVNFTGSDWCIWCKRLEGEIFSKESFHSYASENFVMVELDFPRNGSQPDWLKAQNEKLSEQYGIRGFPTILILSPTGEKIATGGYMPGGPEAFNSFLKSALAKNSQDV